MRTKRLLDLGLVLATAPLFLFVTAVLAMGVWVMDGRPIFFHQPRAGQDRRLYRIWKLRSMTLEPDPRRRRPTRFGGWMRQRGLDELPQLLNVLKGDMSLVGPRPLMPEDVVRFVQQHPSFAARFDVPPGITGLAQVFGARGVTLTAQLDGDYARSRTVAMDLGILLRTLWINLVGKRRGVRQLPPDGRAPR